MITTAVITVIAAYLLGSINFAVIFAKVFLKKDVRTLGSANAGTTNVMRNAGFLPGALTFVCDVLKGFIACFLGKIIFDYILTATGAVWAQPIYGAYICGVACMLGHVFPVFFGFKGGKGVAVSVGIYAVCSWPAIVLGLTAFAISLLVSRIVSLSSIIAAIVVVGLSMVFHSDSGLLLPQIILSLIMGAIVIIKHIDNIKRLLAGTERKIGKGGK